MDTQTFGADFMRVIAKIVTVKQQETANAFMHGPQAEQMITGIVRSPPPKRMNKRIIEEPRRWMV